MDFLNIFGEKCPNVILRAKRDAALSLARGVFEFFNGETRKIDIGLILISRVNIYLMGVFFYLFS